MNHLIKINRQRINQDLRDPDQRKFFSPACYALYESAVPAILQYAQGKFIDIGCGDMPFQKFILGKVEKYDSIDIERRVPEVKYVGDIQNMDMLESQTYDSALCLEVLEHVQNPLKALTEISRILKKEGYLILSLPHLSRLHEEPHDYYRYTKYGLQFLLQEAGFRILSIRPQGGLFCFLGHQSATLFLCPVWHIPILKDILFFLNK